MAKIKHPQRPNQQVQAFKETARALECDESEKAFDKALKKLGDQRAGKPAKSR